MRLELADFGQPCPQKEKNWKFGRVDFRIPVPLVGPTGSVQVRGEEHMQRLFVQLDLYASKK